MQLPSKKVEGHKCYQLGKMVREQKKVEKKHPIYSDNLTNLTPKQRLLRLRCLDTISVIVFFINQ